MKLYARQEKTTDSATLQYWPETKKKDTVFYKDRNCSSFYCRIPWYHSNRPMRRKSVVLNCYRWDVEWV